LLKIGPVDTVTTLLKRLFANKYKIEINASRTYARGACMLQGLNKIGRSYSHYLQKNDTRSLPAADNWVIFYEST